MKKRRLSAIILTYNEEIHIERCLNSLIGVVDDIYIVDSFSMDKTVDIANDNGAYVRQNKWENSYSKQFNWALTNLPIKTDWVLRIDADEYLDKSLQDFLRTKLTTIPDAVSGIYINRRIWFLNKEIKFGGKQKEWQLRIFRYNKGFCEKRWMDEHIRVIEGKSLKVNAKLVDDNLNNITWWVDKHNKYAVREALDSLNEKYGFNKDMQLDSKLLGSQAERKRLLKNYYNKLPMVIGPMLYFTYRYLFLLGFLDGKKGFIFHFLQGFWYRFLVNVKKYEVEKKGDFNKEEIMKIFEQEYGITMQI